MKRCGIRGGAGPVSRAGLCLRPACLGAPGGLLAALRLRRPLMRLKGIKTIRLRALPGCDEVAQCPVFAVC